MQAVVAQAIRAECDFRGWRVLAVNVRTNHVHVVLVAHQHTTEEVLRILKTYATRALRDARLVEPGERVWTRHGSKGQLWTEHGVGRARMYVLDAQ